MKNKIKILILVLSVVLLTGCSGNYNLKINKDLSVEENLYLTIDNTSDAYKNTLKIFDDNKIDKNNYDVSVSGNNVVIEYNEKFKTIDQYLLNSKIYHQLFDNISYNKTEKYIDLYTSQNLKLKGNSYIGNTSDIDVLQINVQMPFKMISDNSDISNDDIYTWTIDKNTENKKIAMHFTADPQSFPYAQVIVISLVVIALTVFAIMIIRMYKEKQQI